MRRTNLIWIICLFICFSICNIVQAEQFEVFYDVTENCKRDVFMWGEDTSVKTMVEFFRWEMKKFGKTDNPNICIHVYNRKIPKIIMDECFNNRGSVDKYPKYFIEAHKADISNVCHDRKKHNKVEYSETVLYLMDSMETIELDREYTGIPCDKLKEVYNKHCEKNENLLE